MAYTVVACIVMVVMAMGAQAVDVPTTGERIMLHGKPSDVVFSGIVKLR